MFACVEFALLNFLIHVSFYYSFSVGYLTRKIKSPWCIFYVITDKHQPILIVLVIIHLA